MKTLLTFLCLILFCTFANAQSCKRYFSTIENVAQFKRQLIEKLSFSSELLNFLELDIAQDKDWSFHYAKSVTWREQRRNLQIEVSEAAKLARSTEIFDAAIDSYSKALELGFDGSSTPGGFGRVGVSIKGTSFHHSFIFGNHNAQYASFYLSLGENTVLKKHSVSENFLEAELQHFKKNSDGTQKLLKTEVLQIYKYDDALMITIKEKKYNGFWRTDLWSQSHTIYIYDLVWHLSPDVTQQTRGL